MLRLQNKDSEASEPSSSASDTKGGVSAACMKVKIYHKNHRESGLFFVVLAKVYLHLLWWASMMRIMNENKCSTVSGPTLKERRIQTSRSSSSSWVVHTWSLKEAENERWSCCAAFKLQTRCERLLTVIHTLWIHRLMISCQTAWRWNEWSGVDLVSICFCVKDPFNEQRPLKVQHLVRVQSSVMSLLWKVMIWMESFLLLKIKSIYGKLLHLTVNVSHWKGVRASLSLIWSGTLWPPSQTGSHDSDIIILRFRLQMEDLFPL